MPFTAVGDEAQMLFRFAGAKPEIMAEKLPQYFEHLQTYKLETNYRSTQEIVAQQKNSIAHNYRDLGGPYDQSLFKVLKPRPDAPDGAELSFEMFDIQEDEANSVAQTIEEITKSGEYAWGDVFVGSRTRSQLGYIEGALTRRGIKFVNLAGGCFWSSKHVQDVISYVKLAHNTDNGDAFKRVYNIASKWFTAPFGTQKGEYINHRYLGRAFWDSVNGHYANTTHVSWRYQKGVDDLRQFVDDVQVALEAGVATAIEFVIDNCYKQWLAAEEGLLNIDESENGKLDDLLTVIEIASKFDDPEAFFNYVTEMEMAAQDAKDGDHSKYVVISTIHRLKGKERPVVFGIGICEGGAQGEMMRPCGLLPHTFSLTAPTNFGVLPTGGKGRVEDERCIFFVLVSRAKDRVYLSGVRYFRDFVMGPSRFVQEIGLIDQGERENDLE